MLSPDVSQGRVMRTTISGNRPIQIAIASGNGPLAIIWGNCFFSIYIISLRCANSSGGNDSMFWNNKIFRNDDSKTVGNMCFNEYIAAAIPANFIINRATDLGSSYNNNIKSYIVARLLAQYSSRKERNFATVPSIWRSLDNKITRRCAAPRISVAGRSALMRALNSELIAAMNLESPSACVTSRAAIDAHFL